MTPKGKSGDGSERQIAVLAYGSLMAHPGEWLGANMQRLIRWETPFPVEYVGISKHRGNAPTLVPCTAHQPVRGGLIVLSTTMTDSDQRLAEARSELARREGMHNDERIKSQLLLGFDVLYADLGVHDKKPSAEHLAQAAIGSVAQCLKSGHPFLNGIRYLRENMEWGVITELTAAYRQAILDSTGTKDLEAAEYKVLEAAILAGPQPAST